MNASQICTSSLTKIINIQSSVIFFYCTADRVIMFGFVETHNLKTFQNIKHCDKSSYTKRKHTFCFENKHIQYTCLCNLFIILTTFYIVEYSKAKEKCIYYLNIQSQQQKHHINCFFFVLLRFN